MVQSASWAHVTWVCGFLVLWIHLECACPSAGVADPIIWGAEELLIGFEIWLGFLECLCDVLAFEHGTTCLSLFCFDVWLIIGFRSMFLFDLWVSTCNSMVKEYSSCRMWARPQTNIVSDLPRILFPRTKPDLTNNNSTRHSNCHTLTYPPQRGEFAESPTKRPRFNRRISVTSTPCFLAIFRGVSSGNAKYVISCSFVLLFLGSTWAFHKCIQKDTHSSNKQWWHTLKTKASTEKPHSHNHT